MRRLDVLIADAAGVAMSVFGQAGRTRHFDPTNNEVIGDAEATKLLKRVQRHPATLRVNAGQTSMR